MTNTNSIVISGRLTKDAEIKKTEKSCLATFSVAYNTYGYNNETKQREERANYIEVKQWGAFVEKIAQYLNKGTMVVVSGKLLQETWETDGVKHSKHCIYADNINLIGGNKENATQVESAEAEADTGDCPF